MTEFTSGDRPYRFLEPVPHFFTPDLAGVLLLLAKIIQSTYNAEALGAVINYRLVDYEASVTAPS